MTTVIVLLAAVWGALFLPVVSTPVAGMAARGVAQSDAFVFDLQTLEIVEKPKSQTAAHA